MIDSERENVLLSQAVARGLLSAGDLNPERAAFPPEGTTLRYGPRLDRLLAEGKITSRQIEKLSSELTAYERTLDGTEQPQRTEAPQDLVSVQVPSWLSSWSHYQVLGLLGQGGMGMVYRARDLQLSREVALKFISVSDQQLRKRFLTEARAQARLSHEHICKISASCRNRDGSGAGCGAVILALIR